MTRHEIRTYPLSFVRPQGWLALDDCGFVGWFDEGRGGASPLHALRARDLDLHTLAAGLVRSGFRLDRRGWVGVDEQHTELQAHPRVLAFQATPTGEERAAHVSSRAEWQRLHAREECLGCVDLDWRGTQPSYRVMEGVEAIPAGELGRQRTLLLTYPELGTYGYVHARGGIPAPYGRRYLPRRPLHVDQLPSGVGQRLRAAPSLPVRFAEAAWLQPVEVAYCDLRGRSYLSSSGRVFRGA